MGGDVQKTAFTVPMGATITLRPITDADLEFLFLLYATTRAEEKVLAGWSDEQWEQFMGMQFNLQHTQYMQNYRNSSFDIIMFGQASVGRFYVDRRVDEYRLIDIALLPEFRCRGIGGSLLRALMLESESHGLPVSLHVEKNNPILDYYRSLGFRVEGDRGVYYFMIRPPAGNGRTNDALNTI
jgi:ribosomal protein S18 acetylase RimI-like enzyme